MHACKVPPPTTSSRAFSFRYHRSGNFVVDRAQRYYRPRRAENGWRERVALLLANNAGSLADILSRPIALFPSASLLFLSLSFPLTLRLGLHAREQPCFCRPIVSARVAASSARPLCEFINVFIHSAGIVSQLLSRVRSASLSANVSFHRRWSPSSLCCALMATFFSRGRRNREANKEKFRLSKEEWRAMEPVAWNKSYFEHRGS